MDPERWQQIEKIFNSVVKFETAEREAFLNEVCTGDDALRQEVERLLAARTEVENFIKSPAINVLARELAGDRAQAPRPDFSGTSLLHYRILEKIGEGGMGVVYRARDERLKRDVAVKILPPEVVTDPERKRRFIQEARAASALSHPNIVTIFDIVSEDGCDFIVMEYVAGKTLSQKIGRKGMKLNDVLKQAIQVADALAAAHAAGIVHRDLKPGNIVVTEDGRVKVLDFGLAKLMQAEPEDGSSRASSVPMQTEEGRILGTAAYMSPEQAEGKMVDARSDIFSFGSVLYEMVTGHRAFTGDSSMATIGAILNREPAPMSDEIPAEFEKLVHRCLRKDPARRFQHMDDVKVALEELKDESDSRKSVSQVAALPAEVRISKRLVIGLAAAALMVAAGIGLWLWKGKTVPTGVALEPKRVAVALFENRTGDPSLDYLGKMAAESITEGLLQIGTIEVVPSS